MSFNIRLIAFAVVGYAAALWALIQKDAQLGSTTALFVVNDHGRHLDGTGSGFASHGCPCEGCRRILCIALGPDFKTGHQSAIPRDQRDVTATVAKLLGLDMPTGQGAVMQELFSQPQ